MTINGNITITGTVDGVDVSALSADYVAKVNQDVRTSASPTFVGATFSGLTASTVVVLNGSKAVASLAYATAATASTIVQRDSSGRTTSTYESTDGGTTYWARKRLSGTVSAGAILSVAHGLNDTRIIAVTGKVYNVTAARWQAISNLSSVLQSLDITASNIAMDLNDNPTAFRNQAFVLFVDYEA
jgi:hypothetical protein